MSTPKYGRMEIELDGTMRVWRMNALAMHEVENALRQLEGKTVGWTRYRSRGNEWTIHDWTLVIWAGLHSSDNTITIDYVREAVTHDFLSEFQVRFYAMDEARLPESWKKKVTEEQEAQEMAKEAAKADLN